MLNLSQVKFSNQPHHQGFFWKYSWTERFSNPNPKRFLKIPCYKFKNRKLFVHKLNVDFDFWCSKSHSMNVRIFKLFPSTGILSDFLKTSVFFRFIFWKLIKAELTEFNNCKYFSEWILNQRLSTFEAAKVWKCSNIFHTDHNK